MDNEDRRIRLLDNRQGEYVDLWVEEVGHNQFRTVWNEGAWLGPFWNRGTEFEATLNGNNEFELVRITKESDFITRRFMGYFSPRYNETDYLFMLSELEQMGGFWQWEGGIVTLNIPKDKNDFVEKVIETLSLYYTELTED